VSLPPQFFILLAGCPRTFALIAVAPGFSASFVPPMVRVALAAALALTLAPLMAGANAQVLDLTPQAYLALLLGELALGAIMGMLLSWLLEAARLAGEVVDLQIGFRAGALYDPVSNGSSSVIGRFWFLAVVVLFFALDGHHGLLRGLMRSYELCPLGTLVYRPSLLTVALEVIESLFVVALQTAAPVVAALMLSDLALGLVGRSMPQMNLMMVGMPAKILVGLAALALSSPMVVNMAAGTLAQMERYLLAVLKAVGA
jgi:flagellar biosynthesis protein FliR